MSTTNLRSGEGAFSKEAILSKAVVEIDFSVNNVLATDFMEILNLPAGWIMVMGTVEVTEASTDADARTIDIGVITYVSGAVDSVGTQVASALDMKTKAITLVSGATAASATHADRVIGINPNHALTSGAITVTLLLAKIL